MIENLKVTAEHVTPWSLVYELALATEGKTPKKEPDFNWIHRVLLAEHSPIRAKLYKIRIENCPTWVWTHLVRHKIGVEWYIKSQRNDRAINPIPREEMPQGTPNDGTMLINAQALINISRKRLCRKASPETRKVWEDVRTAIREIDNIMADAMVNECSYRGMCPEMRPCFKTTVERHEK